MLAIQGRIDHGHHENEAQRALEQTLELDKAVSAALDLVDLEVFAYSLNLQCPGKDLSGWVAEEYPGRRP